MKEAIVGKVTKDNSPWYEWDKSCFTWNFLHNSQLSVKLEEIGEMGTEKLHRHHVVQQFFYVLEGRAEFTFNEKCEFLAKGQGIHVPAGTKHKICNAEKELLQFLVISEPNAHADRENIE